MDLDELKERWRKEAATDTHPTLDAAWIEAINREVGRRLRREALIYIPIVLVPPVLMAMQGFTGTRLILTAGLSLAVTAIVVTLWYSQRRLTMAPLDGSVRQVLTDLLNRVERAGRAYEVAYAGFIGCAAAATAVTVWRQTGSVVWLMVAIPAVALAVWWARRSGRAYVTRLLGPYRAELHDCVQELEKP